MPSWCSGVASINGGGLVCRPQAGDVYSDGFESNRKTNIAPQLFSQTTLGNSLRNSAFHSVSTK